MQINSFFIFFILLCLSSEVYGVKMNQKLICDESSSIRVNKKFNSCINVSYLKNYYTIYTDQYNSIKPTISTNATQLLFSIYPSLPEGLNLNQLTGEIDGTPKFEQSLQNFVITVRYHFSKPKNFFVSISIDKKNKRSLDNDESYKSSGKHFKPFINYKQESYEFYIGFDDSTDEAFWLNPEEDCSLIYSFGESNNNLPSSITIDEETGKISGIAPKGSNGTYTISIIVKLNTSLETISNPYSLTIIIIQPYCPSYDTFPIGLPGERVEGTCDGGMKYVICPNDSKTPTYSKANTSLCNLQFTYNSYTFKFYSYFKNSSSEANLGGKIGNFVMSGIPSNLESLFSIDEYGVVSYDGRNNGFKDTTSTRVVITGKNPEGDELSVSIKYTIQLNKCPSDKEYSSVSIGEKSISKLGCRDGYVGNEKYRECLSTSYPAEWSEDKGCSLGDQISYPKSHYTYYYNFYDCYAIPNSESEFDEYYITGGVLPDGLMIHNNNGTICGIAKSSGIYEITIQGKKGDYTSNYLNLTIFIYEPFCEDESGKIAHAGEYYKNYTECPRLYEGYVGYYCMLDKLDPVFSPNNTGMEYCTAIRTLAPTTPYVPIDYTYTAFTVFLNGLSKEELSLSEDIILINAVIEVFGKIDNNLLFSEDEVLITLIGSSSSSRILRYLQITSQTEIVIQITHQKSQTSSVVSVIKKLVSDSSLLTESIKDFSENEFSEMTSVKVSEGAKKIDGCNISSPIFMMLLMLIMILL